MNSFGIDKRRKAVLILECDCDKLTQQGLAVGDLIAAPLKASFPNNRIDLIKVFSLSTLLERLAELSQSSQKYNTVILNGHSNDIGLQISQDRFLRWDAIANFFPGFKPNRIVALACEAGKSNAASAMFATIPTLKEIFASPFPTDKTQAAIVVGKTLHVLGLRQEVSELNVLMQIANFALTGNIMIHRLRSEFEEH